MARPTKPARGQAMVEYVIIATVVILAILFARPLIQTSVRSLYTEAKNKVTQAATDLKNL